MVLELMIFLVGEVDRFFMCYCLLLLMGNLKVNGVMLRNLKRILLLCFYRGMGVWFMVYGIDKINE